MNSIIYSRFSKITVRHFTKVLQLPNYSYFIAVQS